MIPPLQQILFEGYPTVFPEMAVKRVRVDNPKRMVLEAIKNMGHGTCRQISDFLEGEMSSYHVNGYVKQLAKEGKVKQHSVFTEHKRRPAVVWELT